MSRKVRVATTSLCVWQGPTGPVMPDGRNALEYGCALLDEAAEEKPDIVCLPETFAFADRPTAERIEPAEPIPGPVFEAIATRARRHGMYVVAGLQERRGDAIVNTCCLIDRDGRLVGQYDKMHPTIGELNLGVRAGTRAHVFETDFGRVGAAICFDIGWPGVWKSLADQGAEVVFWPSAYAGGFPLRAYAWTNSYYVVSSIWTTGSMIIDKTGTVLARTAGFCNIVTREIDLDRHVFHIDSTAAKLPALRARAGDRLLVELLPEENMLTLATADPELSLADLVEEFGLERLSDYLERSTAAVAKSRLAGE